jgi:hypothetical protein
VLRAGLSVRANGKEDQQGANVASSCLRLHGCAAETGALHYGHTVFHCDWTTIRSRTPILRDGEGMGGFL